MGQVARAGRDVVESLQNLVEAYQTSASGLVPLEELESILDWYEEQTT